jgi:uncharacterized protein involved in exopolysaccharide biosynthesis
MSLQTAAQPSGLSPAQPLPDLRSDAKGRRLPMDPWRLVTALRRRWHWIALAACVSAIAGGAVGFGRARCLVPVTLTLRDLSPRFPSAGREGIAYKPPQLSPQTMVNFLTSPELLRDVSSRARPAITERQLSESLQVTPEKDSETVHVRIIGSDPGSLVALANLYTAEAVARSRDAQREDPTLMYDNFTRQLGEIEKQKVQLNSQLAAFRSSSGLADPAVEQPAFEKEWVELRIKTDMAAGELELLQKKQGLLLAEPIQKRLDEATAQLMACEAQGKTDEHPDVKRLRDEITQLNRQLADTTANRAPSIVDALYASQTASLASRKKSLEIEIQQLQTQAGALDSRLKDIYAHSSDFDQIKAGLDRLESYRGNLNSRRFEAEQYRDAAEGYFQTPPPAQLSDVDSRARYSSASALATRSGFLGLLAAVAAVMLLETADARLKTVADVKRVTHLPVLATLGDLNQMDEPARRAWAFRTWTILSGALSPSPNQGALCGFISAAHGEGRSTWVELLAGAARERGFEVVRIDFSNGHPAGMPESATHGDGSPSPTPAAPSAAILAPPPPGPLAASRSGSVVHLRLPGELWNLDRRMQFQNELAQWRFTSSAVILVDLPPASLSESVLIAENLPQLIWLADAGKSHSRDTRLHLNTLRHARCNLVGAVLNHEPEPLLS